jgi:hypothetical protein
LSALSNRQRNERTGRWCMVSGEDDSILHNKEGRVPSRPGGWNAAAP